MASLEQESVGYPPSIEEMHLERVNSPPLNKQEGSSQLVRLQWLRSWLVGADHTP